MSETLILGTQLTSEHKKRMVKLQRVYRREVPHFSWPCVSTVISVFAYTRSRNPITTDTRSALTQQQAWHRLWEWEHVCIFKLVELGCGSVPVPLGSTCVSSPFVSEGSYRSPRFSAFMLTKQFLQSISSCEEVVTNRSYLLLSIFFSLSCSHIHGNTALCS